TDDMRIAEVAFAWGAEVALTSPKHQSGTDRIAEVAARAKNFSIIINVQGDEPLIQPQLIDRVVETLLKNREVGIVTAAHPLENSRDALSPHQVKVVIDLAANHGSPGVDTPSDAEAVAASLRKGSTSSAGLRLQKSKARR